MPKPKKKLLPKNFEELLEKSEIADLKAIFNLCDVNARGGYSKQSALAFDKCPDDLARWLVEQGADLNATDSWGNTPLHSRSRSRRSTIKVLLELGADVTFSKDSTGTPLHSAADSHNSLNARLLLEHGAKVDEKNDEGLTPLELALRGCSNIDIAEMADLAKVLLEFGAKKTSRMKDFVLELGKQFEFHRSGFNPDYIEATEKGLTTLYELFNVTPIPRRQVYDGKSPILIKATSWKKRHSELWDLLVPSSGPATTKQGEAIRISGRIADELERNGGINWDSDFSKMADAFLDYIQCGNPLEQSELSEASSIITLVKRQKGDLTRMAQLAVKWVILNPQPISLGKVSYKR